ncbi:MAG: hypothetical protein ACI9JN_002944, partial [Bacteroidia bacterium]
ALTGTDIARKIELNIKYLLTINPP